MNFNLKAVYVCVTAAHRWGKGKTIKEAKKNASLTTKAQEKSLQFYVQAAVFNNPTDAELDHIFGFIQTNSIDGTPKYYDDNRTEEDTEQINRLHVGWLMVEKNF